MYDAKQEIQDLADAVYGLVESLGRGDVLPNDAIEAVVGAPPNVHPWPAVMAKVARRLRKERGIAFWPNHAGGKRLCTVQEQNSLPGERLRRMVRHARKGRRDANAIPAAEMTERQRLTRFFNVNALRDAERAARLNAKAIKAQLAPAQQPPKRPMMACADSL